MFCFVPSHLSVFLLVSFGGLKEELDGKIGHQAVAVPEANNNSLIFREVVRNLWVAMPFRLFSEKKKDSSYKSKVGREML